MKKTKTQIFVNLPVKNLNKSMMFFKKLGFTFNKKFTNKNAACMIITDDIYSMLVVEKFFKTFTNKKISNAKTSTEVLLALSFESRKKVDEISKTAVKAGGKVTRKPVDHGWMYGQTFEDLDGHIWEAFWMDEKKRK